MNLLFGDILLIFIHRGIGDPATKEQKQSNPPIPYLKLATKVYKSGIMPAYVPAGTL